MHADSCCTITVNGVLLPWGVHMHVWLCAHMGPIFTLSHAVCMANCIAAAVLLGCVALLPQSGKHFIFRLVCCDAPSGYARICSHVAPSSSLRMRLLRTTAGAWNFIMAFLALRTDPTAAENTSSYVTVGLSRLGPSSWFLFYMQVNHSVQ